MTDVHTEFGLSYANYLVLPRTLLQSMPEEWQARFVTCLDELRDAFRHVEQAECYDVIPGVEREVDCLSEHEMRWTGVTFEDGQFYNRDGDEVEPWFRVVVPRADPVPHYDRGRTRIEPAGIPVREVQP